MNSIYAYQKFIDAQHTVEMVLPVDPVTNQRIGIELATVGAITYVSVPAGQSLPDQPAEINPQLLTDVPASLISLISDASPHVRMIRSMAKEKIATHYSVEDEIKLLRTAPSEEFDIYNAFVEDARAWGRTERAKLGL